MFGRSGQLTFQTSQPLLRHSETNIGLVSDENNGIVVPLYSAHGMAGCCDLMNSPSSPSSHESLSTLSLSISIIFSKGEPLM